MNEKPLHLRVAEALGWTDIHRNGELWVGKEPGFNWAAPPPRYDTDWSATGPLIEKYTVHLDPVGPDRGDQDRVWNAYQFDDESVEGPTPLIAVCRLILALNEAGTL